MNLSQIKNLVKQNGDKIILMEGGEPEVVLMSFIEYEKLARANFPEISNQGTRSSSMRYNNPTYSPVDGQPMRETEFITPVESVRPVEIAESNSDSRLPQRETGGFQNIRLEDLPI